MMNRKHQQGVSLIGMLFWAIIVVSAALVVMKLFPAYEEYFVVKKVLFDIGQDPDLKNMSNSAIREKFIKLKTVDDIHSVDAQDLEISRDKGGLTVVSAEYTYQTRLIGNISLLVDFHASSDSGESRTVQAAGG
jgi:hypothetical protein